jgi:hypothetical protein
MAESAAAAAAAASVATGAVEVAAEAASAAAPAPGAVDSTEIQQRRMAWVNLVNEVKSTLMAVDHISDVLKRVESSIEMVKKLKPHVVTAGTSLDLLRSQARSAFDTAARASATEAQLLLGPSLHAGDAQAHIREAEVFSEGWSDVLVKSSRMTGILRRAEPAQAIHLLTELICPGSNESTKLEAVEVPLKDQVPRDDAIVASHADVAGSSLLHGSWRIHGSTDHPWEIIFGMGIQVRVVLTVLWMLWLVHCSAGCKARVQRVVGEKVHQVVFSRRGDRGEAGRAHVVSTSSAWLGTGLAP